MDDSIPPPTNALAPASMASGDERPRHPNRGFWLIATGLLVVGAAVVAGAILTRPEPPSPTAAGNLDLALRAARIVRDASGSYAAADVDELGVVELRLAFVGGEEPSTGPTVVSVLPARDAWAAAALASDGSCRWVRVEESGALEDVARGRTSAPELCSAEAATDSTEGSGP